MRKLPTTPDELGALYHSLLDEGCFDGIHTSLTKVVIDDHIVKVRAAYEKNRPLSPQDVFIGKLFWCLSGFDDE